MEALIPAILPIALAIADAIVLYDMLHTCSVQRCCEATGGQKRWCSQTTGIQHWPNLLLPSHAITRAQSLSMHQPRVHIISDGTVCRCTQVPALSLPFSVRASTFLPSFENKFPPFFFSLSLASDDAYASFSVELFSHTPRSRRGKKRILAGWAWPFRSLQATTHQLAQNYWILECRSGGASVEESVGQRWALVC
jgi:hypothetical protein